MTKKTDYKNLAFDLFIITLTINFILFFLTIGYESLFSDPYRFLWTSLVLNTAQFICLFAGFFLLSVSITKRERKDVKFIVTTIGLAFFLIFGVITH